MEFTSKIIAAFRSLFIKDAAGNIALRTISFTETTYANAASSQSPRSLEALTLGAIGLDADGKPALRLQSERPYKVYTALVSQAGVAAPTVKVLENTIGALVPAYEGVGDYSLTLADAFTADKTAIIIGTQGATDLISITAGRLDANVIDLKTYSGGVLTDAVLSADTTIEIRVYR